MGPMAESSSGSDARLAGSAAEAGVGILDQFSHDVTEELCVGGAVVEVATIVAGWRSRIEETKRTGGVGWMSYACSLRRWLTGERRITGYQ